MLLHDLTAAGPFQANVADQNRAVVDELFAAARQDAKRGFPDRILKLARSPEDAPGCNEVRAAALRQAWSEPRSAVDPTEPPSDSISDGHPIFRSIRRQCKRIANELLSSQSSAGPDLAVSICLSLIPCVVWLT